MTDSSQFEPWKTLIAYADAGEGDELEAFVVAIGPSETFRALLRLEPAQRELVLTTLTPTEAADIMEEIPDEHAADFIEQLSVLRWPQTPCLPCPGEAPCPCS